jgi:hypothetical protein
MPEQFTMDTSNSGFALPRESHYTLSKVMQIVWVSHQYPANVDFHDPRMAAKIDITQTALDAAATIKNDLEAAFLTLSSGSRADVDGMYMFLSKAFCPGEEYSI